MDTKTAKEIFSNDRFASHAAGISIEEAADGYARCSMPLSDIHYNAVGGVMGGAIFTLADFVFAIASNNDPAAPTVAADASIRFLAPAGGKILYGESAMLRSGYKSCVAEVSITDELGTLVAKATFGGSRSHKSK